MKIGIVIAAMAVTVSSGALAAEVAKPETKMKCCCKKGEDGKMACCQDKAKTSDKSGHEGHAMGNMEAK